MPRIRFHCQGCGTSTVRHHQARKRLCLRCDAAHRAEGARAVNAVQRAIRTGEMPPATELRCEDCGGDAQQYDHRDYTQPLRVDAVCRSCNQKRGRAFSSLLRPAAQGAA